MKKSPNTFKEGMALPQGPRWEEASGREFASLEKHDVYEQTPTSSAQRGHRVIGTRWVMKIKADGRYQSYLVV